MTELLAAATKSSGSNLVIGLVIAAGLVFFIVWLMRKGKI